MQSNNKIIRAGDIKAGERVYSYNFSFVRVSLDCVDSDLRNLYKSISSKNLIPLVGEDGKLILVYDFMLFNKRLVDKNE